MEFMAAIFLLVVLTRRNVREKSMTIMVEYNIQEPVRIFVLVLATFGEFLYLMGSSLYKLFAKKRVKPESVPAAKPITINFCVAHLLFFSEVENNRFDPLVPFLYPRPKKDIMGKAP